jgi:hypothetical protein
LIFYKVIITYSLKEAGITWEKLSHINLPKNDELVKEKKVREELLVK